jgi:hypothetical protein
MTGSPFDAAEDGATDRDDAGGADAGWLLIAFLMSLAGLVVLILALAGRIVVPLEAPSLAPSRGWDGWPAVWRAMWESANAGLIVIGAGIMLGLLWKKRHDEPARVPRLGVALTVGPVVARLLVAAVRQRRSHRIQGIVRTFRNSRAREDLTILGAVAGRMWRSSRPLPSVPGVVTVVLIDTLLVVGARVLLGSRYPDDILAGIVGGTGALTLFAWSRSPGSRVPEPATETQTADVGEALATEPVRSSS